MQRSKSVNGALQVCDSHAVEAAHLEWLSAGGIQQQEDKCNACDSEAAILMQIAGAFEQSREVFVCSFKDIHRKQAL